MRQRIRLTESDLHRMIKESVRQVLKEQNSKKSVQTAQQRLADGEDPRNIFDYVGRFVEGFARVAIGNKNNFINQNGELLSKQWFDSANDFDGEGLAIVYLNNKYNLINRNGELLLKQWFDYISDFCFDVSKVILNNKYNYIKRNGELLSKQWFDGANDFDGGFGLVRLGSKYYYLDHNGMLNRGY